MRNLSIITLIFILFSSCEYSSNEVFYVEIDTDHLPDVHVTSNLNPIDTFDILDSIFFKYDVALDTGIVYISNVYFDNYYIFNSEKNADSLWINPADTLSSGLYEISLVVFYKTATGSLADRFDLEYLVMDTSWKVVLTRELL